MNETLVEIVADFAILMEFADDSDVSSKTAANALEAMSSHLQDLDDAQKAEFTAALQAVASRRSRPAERRFLERLPVAAGIVEE